MTNTQSSDYQRVARLLHWLDEHAAGQPGLGQLARVAGLSPAHLQKLFSRWAGVSPKQYLGFVTQASARARLREESVLASAHTVGLSSPGRLHDLMIQWTAMTPGEYRRQGAGLTLRYGIHPSPFGPCLLAVTDRGLCHLAFADDDAGARREVRTLAEQWPQARLEASPDETAGWLARVFPDPGSLAQPQPLRLMLRGSPFQLRVWEALLAIPPGALVSYQAVATQCGKPQASRAVASAVARNRIGYLIPCHRVIRATGHFGGYRWGPLRKQAMIAWEAARTTHRA